MPARRPSSPSQRPAARPAARGADTGRGATSGRSGATARSGRSTASTGRGSGARKAPARPRTSAHGSVPASARGKGARAALNRPGGPDRRDRRRSRTGLVLPEVLTVRLLVLGVVVLIAAVLLVPTVRAAVQQSMELHQLEADVAAREAESQRLSRELDRWADPAFIEGQARDRLLYVMPGDQVWRTIGDEGIVEDIDPATGKPVEAGVVAGHGESDTPWYTTLWGSVQVADGPGDDAGEGEQVDDGTPSGQ